MLDFLATFPQFDSFSLNAVIRLFIAAVCGGILGLERMRKMYSASVRTYMLVCVGASTAVLTGMYLNLLFDGQTDVARIAAQVISGIGFIGAGTIMVSGYHRVRGVTTAAGLWVAACMGLAIGSGFVLGGIVLLIFAEIIMFAGGHLQQNYRKKSRRLYVYILFEDADIIPGFLKYLAKIDLDLEDFEVKTPIGKCVSVNISMKLLGTQNHAETFEKLKKYEGISFIKEI